MEEKLNVDPTEMKAFSIDVSHNIEEGRRCKNGLCDRGGTAKMPRVHARRQGFSGVKAFGDKNNGVIQLPMDEFDI